tara:strand:- start:758 stop:1156 length:399 start_codon:yes stop_codon:yes gene_type:complete
MGIFNFFRKKPTKKEVTDQYTKKNDLPSTIKNPFGGEDMYKKDMTGLIAYLRERPNMERIYNEFTWSIRNGYSVKKYLNDGNLMRDAEIKMIVSGGFSDIAGFLKEMLDMHNNPELKKDYDACIEAVKILNA